MPRCALKTRQTELKTLPGHPNAEILGSPRMIEVSYSPKVVATALGVSESSLKRWCDGGKIEVTKTAGGHRRIPRNAVLNFARDHQFEIANPELIGLPKLARASQVDLSSAREDLLEMLIAGDEANCRRILIELYLAGFRISSIGDEVIGPVFQEIGHLWECSSLEIYQERLSCEICSRSLMQLRSMLRRPSEGAPLAIGGTPEDDPYALPTALVEMVITQNDYKAVSLGSRIPWESLIAAAQKMQPGLMWFSVSYLENQKSFLDGFKRLAETLDGKVPIIAGGQGLSEELLSHMQPVVHCDSLSKLDSILQNFKPGRTS